MTDSFPVLLFLSLPLTKRSSNEYFYFIERSQNLFKLLEYCQVYYIINDRCVRSLISLASFSKTIFQ